MSSDESSIRCRRSYALAYARLIRAQFPEQRIHVFGDVALTGYGPTLDLIVEVDKDQYQIFRSLCKNRGMRWITDAVVNPDSDRWKDQPLMMYRTDYALFAIAYHERKKLLEEWTALDMALAVKLPADIINLICVPEGWFQGFSLRQRTLRGLPKGCEDIIEKIAREAREIANE